MQSNSTDASHLYHYRIDYWSEECYRVLGFGPRDGLPRIKELIRFCNKLLAANELLQIVRVARSLKRDLIGGGVDFAEIVRR